MTLVEMVVVLLVLGLAASLSAPLVSVRPPSADAPLRRALDAARRIAVRRAESVVLDVAADGRWSIRRTAADDGPALLADSMPAGGPLRVQVSALGVCTIEVGSRDWDAFRCGPSDGAGR
jgi:hypothetical protein